MAQVIAGAEEVVEALVIIRHVLIIIVLECNDDAVVNRFLQGIIGTHFSSILLTRQQHRTLWVFGISHLTVANGDIGLWHEESLLRRTEQVVIPITDRIVLIVGHIIDDEFLTVSQRGT